MNITSTIEKLVVRPVARPLADDKFERELRIKRIVSDAFLAQALRQRATNRLRAVPAAR